MKRALVVYDSLYGNTQKVAVAIVEGMASEAKSTDRLEPNNSMEPTRPAQCLALARYYLWAGRAAHLEAVGRRRPSRRGPPAEDGRYQWPI